MISTKPTIRDIDNGRPTNTLLVGSPPDHSQRPQLVLGQGYETGMTILMADDDSDDCLLAQEAWDEIKSKNTLQFVHDGQEVLDYLFHQGSYIEHALAPRPGIILLDLNMPKRNGHEVLTAIKTHTNLQMIPIIVFTTTRNIDEIIQAYKEGANAFMTKPTSFDGYRNTLHAVDHYWLQLVQLPHHQSS